MKVFRVRTFVTATAWGLAMVWSAAPASAIPHLFTTASLNGRYTARFAPAKSFSADAPGDPGGVASAARQDVLKVGLIDFNGIGSASGRTVATTDDNAGQTVVIDFTWTGSYTVNADGTGTLSITPAVSDTSCTPAQPAGVCATFEGAETYAFTMSKRLTTISFLETDNAGGAKIFARGEAILQHRGPFFFITQTIRKRWAFRLEPAKGFAADAPGDPAGVASAGRQDVLWVGVIDWDGVGGISGHTIATTDTNSGQTVIIDFNWTGTYSIDVDGIGRLTINPAVTDASCTPAQAPGVCATFESSKTFAYSVSKSRQRMFWTETDNAGGAKIFLSGEAHAQ
jgi:hypothetical protein